MADDPIPFPGTFHGLQITRDKISIFPESISRNALISAGEGNQIVFVSIGPGETKVNIIDSEGTSFSSWVAVFGWSSLCDIKIWHDGENLPITNVSMITKAIRGDLRIYGEKVETSDFARIARQSFRNALDHILKETIGDGSQHDKIVLACPSWMQDVLSTCLDLRPHIDQVIQDI